MLLGVQPNHSAEKFGSNSCLELVTRDRMTKKAHRVCGHCKISKATLELSSNDSTGADRVSVCLPACLPNSDVPNAQSCVQMRTV